MLRMDETQRKVYSLDVVRFDACFVRSQAVQLRHPALQHPSWAGCIRDEPSLDSTTYLHVCLWRPVSPTQGQPLTRGVFQPSTKAGPGAVGGYQQWQAQADNSGQKKRLKDSDGISENFWTSTLILGTNS